VGIPVVVTKKLTVSDALVVARSPQGMRGMYTNCILRTVRRIPTPSTFYVGDTGQSRWWVSLTSSKPSRGCVSVVEVLTLQAVSR